MPTPPVPREYQAQAISAGIKYFLHDKSSNNAFIIAPTGSGKSLIIANIAGALEAPCIVFQPSKEILVQNYAKFMAYGYRAGIYSASVGHKFVEKITYATIGSVVNKKHLFEDIKYIIVDECDLVNAQGGRYQEFISHFPKAKVLGLTATPYRLGSSMEGAMLKFINRTNPRIFNKCIFFIQTETLFRLGFLAKLEYFSFNVIDRSMLRINSQGTDFTEDSVRAYYRKINMPSIIISYALRLLEKRKNLLVFCSLIEEANTVSKSIPGSYVVTGKTKATERDRILRDFRSGKIRCVINVGVLVVGFDFPELECILMGRSTMSLRLYYQIIGRLMRIHKDKASAWFVDLGANIKLFGKVETMRIVHDERGLMSIWNNGRQLTNVTFTRD